MSTARAAPSPWILDAPRDLLLFVGTPLLILPLVHLLSLRVPSETIYLAVASFGALGHHLPGMMRAYGDRALFRRFRVRFVAAPIFLVAACVGFALVELSVVLLVVFVWGVWHGLMQIHGFLRIYDSKAGSFGRTTAWLDQAACVAWFASAIVFSDTRVHFFLDHFYSAGGGLVSPAWIGALRAVLGAATAVVTVLYVLHALRCRAAGRPQSLVKHLLLVTSVSFFWYANVFVSDLLIAVVLFEIFHDVQYLAIVWLFNRRRADSAPECGGFTRFLFRPSPLLVALYLGLIFAYGGLNVANETLLSGAAFQVAAGVLAASALLHFYYDGFIWKMREAGTRSALGLEGSEDARARPTLGLPAWTRHGLKWALFVVPLGAFGVALAENRPDEERIQLLLAASLPEDAEAQRNRAVVHYQRGDREEAAEAYRRALELASGDAALSGALRADLSATLFQLGLDDLRAGRGEAARGRLVEAGRLAPGLAERAFQAALAAGREGDRAEEEWHYRAALVIDESHGPAAFNLAVTLAQQGRRDEALSWAARAAGFLPGDPRPAQLRARLGGRR